jgi:hypothetical protein
MLLSSRYILAIYAAFLSAVMMPSQAEVVQANPLTIDKSTAYTPAPRPKPQRTEGGGSRGCLSTDEIALQLLVPKDHSAFTASEHPTLSWYISEIPSIPLELSVVEDGVPQPIFVKRLKVEKAGLMQFKLPENISGLEVGRQYRWTVSLICNSARPSQSIYARAWMERAPQTTDFAETIAKLSEYDKALAYIQAGIWYDAVASISKSYLNGSDPSLASNLLQNLLHQVGLVEVSAIKLL